MWPEFVCSQPLPPYYPPGVKGILKKKYQKLKKNEIIVREEREFAENIIATVREPLVILDKNLKLYIILF